MQQDWFSIRAQMFPVDDMGYASHGERDGEGQGKGRSNRGSSNC
jgi:hypothetical protein